MNAAKYIVKRELRDIENIIAQLDDLGPDVRATAVINDSNGDRLGVVKRTSRARWSDYAFFPAR